MLRLAWPAAAVDRQTAERPLALTVHDVLAVINASRTQNGRPGLVIDDRLSAAARLKLADMQDRAYVDHVNPDGQYVWPLLQQLGCYYRHAGENLASGYSDAQQLERVWLRSRAHRDNILDRRYGVIGVAVAQHPPLAVVLFADSCRSGR